VSPEPGQPWPKVDPKDKIQVEPWGPPRIRKPSATKAQAKAKRQSKAKPTKTAAAA
jgi:hypothetical protein